MKTTLLLLAVLGLSFSGCAMQEKPAPTTDVNAMNKQKPEDKPKM